MILVIPRKTLTVVFHFTKFGCYKLTTFPKKLRYGFFFFQNMHKEQFQVDSSENIKDTMKAYLCQRHTLLNTMTLSRVFYLFQIYIVRWDEHSDIGKNSEPTKHLNQFTEHRFNWKILRRVPNKVRQRTIREAYYVMCMRPTLNNQLELTSLTLFRNGVTQKNVFKLLLVSFGFYRL